MSLILDRMPIVDSLEHLFGKKAEISDWPLLIRLFLGKRDGY